jgi:CheY-like chemotaxis protein
MFFADPGQGMAKRKSSRRPRAKSKRRAAAHKPQPRAVEAALAGIAHDIRTPLTGILALAELLASSDLGERERQWANAVKSGAEHLAALTTLIIDAAKASATGLTLRREPFAPRRLAEAVGATLKARAETKGIGADVTVADGLPALVAGDELRLRAALENLADNAVKFTDTGSVAITAAAEPAGKSRVRLIFTVSDSGVGLSKQDLARLFKPFAQASAEIARRYGGAGLGLVFVRRLARAMGGDLTVESAPGRGSTFRLSVTVERVAARSDAEPHPSSRTSTHRALSVLCAEDNPYGRVVMNTILTELGHRADFVTSGEAAVSAVARDTYDVVLMDVALPVVDGLEATRRIRALPGATAHIRIIGISGRTEPGAARAAREAGMDFYFTKPVSPGKLAQALAALR